MKILVLNCGSSSLKYQLIDMSNKNVLAKGNYERIGTPGSFVTHKKDDFKVEVKQDVKNHEEAIKIVIDQLLHTEYGVISSLEEIAGIGHRVVHGGEKFANSVIINDEVLEAIRECIELAPLHNPAAIFGIEGCKKLMPNTPMVAVFDTAFHQTIPEKAYTYPIPYKYYEKYKVRRYGFHGTSHKFVSLRVAEILNKKPEDLKIVVCHLGQGASLCAVKQGKSVDTSMGMTPVAGIPMVTRCGDIDPSIVTFLIKKENLTAEEIDSILNKQSGLHGISGVNPDFRDIEAAAKSGDAKAKLAIDNYFYLISQYIGKYAVSMNGVDVIAFAGGIGENGTDVRERICENLGFLGLEIDAQKNNAKGEEAIVSTNDSKVKVMVVPTNEELMIAKETAELNY